VKTTLATIAFILFLASPAMAVVQMFDGAATADFSGELGVQQKWVSGERPSQFTAYRDLPNGFAWGAFHFYAESNDPEQPYYLKLFGRDLLQDDQILGMETGLRGDFRLRLGYKETPRLYSTGNHFLEQYAGNGRYVIDPNIPQTLQAFPDPAGSAVLPLTDDAAFRSSLANFLKGAQSIDLRTDRKTSTAELIKRINDSLSFRLNYQHDDKEGTKLTGFGAFDRNFVTATNFEQFRAVLFELPEQVDYHTDILRAGLDFTRDEGLVQLTYEFQNFNNGIDTLRWDNPFRAADRTAGSPADPNLFGLVTAHGLMDLPPGGHSHIGTLSGTWMLPLWKSRFTWTLTGGGTWQDDRFAPFTQNSVMTASNLPGLPLVSTLTPDGGSLKAAVLNFTQNYQLAMHPSDALSLTARYRYYYYDNKTPNLLFPGYSGNSDSEWVAGLIKSTAPSYLRQNGDLDAEYMISRQFSARMNIGWERWRRWERSEPVTDERKLGAGLTVKPAKWAKLLVDYKFGRRDAGPYDARMNIGPDEQTARQSDLDGRTRHMAETSLIMNPTKDLDIRANGSYTCDGYDTSRLGLRRRCGWLAGTQVSYVPAAPVTVTAGYSLNENRSLFLGGDKISAAAPAGPFFQDQNFVYTKMRDKSENYSLGASGYIIRSVLTYDVSYNYTRGTVTTNPYNPNIPDINGAVALPLESTRVATHCAKAGLFWQLSKNLSLNFRYLFEKFNVADPAWDVLGNQISPLYQDGALYIEDSRALLLNSQYSNYTAHAGSVTLSYSF
jgi:MtrB/PioB family decaheme-associated outer membrane protein